MSERRIETVGLIGLGKMGLPMVRHMVGKGFKIAGFDLDPAKCEAARLLGARVASSPADAAKDSDMTIVAVGFDSEAEACVLRANGVAKGAKRNSVIGIASTVAPGTVRKFPKRAGRPDLVFIDMPMCRGEEAAENGKLLLMGGGDKAAFDACRPVFAAFASDVFHLGPLGSGEVGKMVNNMILWACISANHEGLKLGHALGVDPETLRAALVVSSANNWALEVRIEDKPMPWAEKDMMLVLKEADAVRLSLPLAGSVKEVIKGIKIERNVPTPKMPED